MSTLAITHMTLYKHGAGFFRREARLSGDEVKLSFRAEDMNDVLKSLTAFDRGGGHVLGVEYPTPQSREQRLAGCSIRLGDERSLRDLLAGLRGRRVRLVPDQGDEAVGTLLGLDELPERQPLAAAPVSLLLDDSPRVRTLDLGRVREVEILDAQGAADLRFFLATAVVQESRREVTIRLTPGEHDLAVGYVAAAPAWRVSYRLVLDPSAEGGPRALLQGWGIFDNRLEEDLTDVSLVLVAGMPISFVYDLVTPFTPERPSVGEEARVAPGPVEFEAPVARAKARPMARLAEAASADLLAPAGRGAPVPARDVLAQAAPAAATGEALGELFQYVVAAPVTVRRGESAMVPIVSVDLGYRKELLYNPAKLPAHPVATLRLKNESGLTLERGPVTVLDDGEYVGEAIVPFSVAGAEMAVPYAVELGLKAREESGADREVRRLRIAGYYMQIEEWDLHWREVGWVNSSGAAARVLVEHPQTSGYELYDTPAPVERTADTLRFEVEVPARGEAKLRVQERRLISRQEELRRQSYESLRRYLRGGLLDQGVYDRVVEILKLWDAIADRERGLAQIGQERDRIYKTQEQIRGNLGALGREGKEGALRARYVDQLEAAEDQLKALAERDASTKAEMERLQREVEQRVQALG